MVLRLEFMACTNKAHLLPITVYIVIARDAENSLRLNTGNACNLIEKGNHLFVLLCLTSECKVPGREHKIDCTDDRASPLYVAAHRR